MSTLIPEFARAIMESNRRATNSVDSAIRSLEKLRSLAAKRQDLEATEKSLLRRLARQAREATRSYSKEVLELNDLWEMAIQAMRSGMAPEEQIEVLRTSAELADAMRDFGNSTRRMWTVVEEWGGENEGTADLVEADRQLDRVRAEVTKAIQARSTSWQPRDPIRLEQGKKEIREGKGLGPDAARARFRTGE